MSLTGLPHRPSRAGIALPVELGRIMLLIGLHSGPLKAIAARRASLVRQWSSLCYLASTPITLCTQCDTGAHRRETPQVAAAATRGLLRVTTHHNIDRPVFPFSGSARTVPGGVGPCDRHHDLSNGRQLAPKHHLFRQWLSLFWLFSGPVATWPGESSCRPGYQKWVSRIGNSGVDHGCSLLAAPVLRESAANCSMSAG